MNRSHLLIGIIVAGVVAVITLFSSMFTVNQAEQALVLQFGSLQREIREPGLYFKIPFLQSVVHYDKRVLNVNVAQLEATDVDQKKIVVDMYGKYRIVDPLRFYQTVRTEANMEDQLSNLMRETLLGILAGVEMGRVMTAERADLMRQITTEVAATTQQYGIDVIDVRMKRVDLPAVNSEAVFARMSSQRKQEAAGIRASGQRDAQALRAEADKQQVIIVADAHRQAEILRGEGDAGATRIYSDAYGRDPEFFDLYRSLQAMEIGLPGETTTYVGPATGDFFRFFGEQPGTAQ
jgi:modulator of FtsH protease HflC